MTERFYEGQKVVCINENFPQIRTTLQDKSKIGRPAIFHPIIGETIIIDEILGPFLRFNKYDTDSYNWWHCSRFTPLDEFKISFKSAAKHKIKISGN